MWKWLKSRLWDVEATVWGAPEVHGIHYRVPLLRRLARFLGQEPEIAAVLIMLILMTIYVYCL